RPASTGADPPNRSEQMNGSPAEGHPRNYLWSELMKRVFAADVLTCDHCGGRLRIVATIRPPETTRKILDHLGLPSRPPPLAPAYRNFLSPPNNLVLTTMENSCVHLCPHRRPSAALIFSAHRKN